MVFFFHLYQQEHGHLTSRQIGAILSDQRDIEIAQDRQHNISILGFGHCSSFSAHKRDRQANLYKINRLCVADTMGAPAGVHYAEDRWLVRCRHASNAATAAGQSASAA